MILMAFDRVADGSPGNNAEAGLTGPAPADYVSADQRVTDWLAMGSLASRFLRKF